MPRPRRLAATIVAAATIGAASCAGVPPAGPGTAGRNSLGQPPAPGSPGSASRSDDRLAAAGHAGAPPAAGTPAGAAAEATKAWPAVPQPEEFGEVLLTIRWPRRAQVIPLSANSMWVRILDGNQVLAERVEPRVAGQDLAALSLRVKAKNGLQARVEAFAKLATQAADLAGEEASARGVTVINVGRAKTSRVSLDLQPLTAPAITGLEPNVGRAGDTIVIAGLNLGGPAPAVVFNAATASAVALVGTASLQVTVPAGATVGPVTIYVDGVRAPNPPAFWVVDALAISGDRPPWSPAGDAGALWLLARAKTTFRAGYKWVPNDPAALEKQFGTLPQLAWKTTNGAAGQLTKSLSDATVATYTAADNAGATTVTADLGGLVSNQIVVTGVRVSAIVITPAVVSLALPRSDPLPAGYQEAKLRSQLPLVGTVSNTANLTIGGVRWESADSTLAQVDSATGLVTAVAAGLTAVKATSLDDDRVSATVSVQVRDVGILDLTVR